MTSSLLKGLLETGAPWGILCAVLLAAVFALWRRCNLVSDKLYALGLAQVEHDKEICFVMERIREDVREIRRNE